jgi:hypothetical protein
VRQLCLIVLISAFAARSALLAQISPSSPPPQSARQALIEMFMGKGENDFAKHLPEDARQTLIHKGETPETNMILRISNFGHMLAERGGHLETFDTGLTLLRSEQSDGREKLEVNVEHDSLMGEDDEIELSIQYYKAGQLETLPVVPRLIFTFRQEKEIWRLTEVTAAVHAPLTDPDYLKGLRKQQDKADEAQAQMRINIIAGAEAGYIAKHPDLGYSCSLTTLFARDPDGTPGENSGSNADPGQGGSDWNGYTFALTGCDGNPVAKYRISATPDDSDANIKTFCTDQSGTMKFVVGEKISTCFSHGQPVGSNNGAD